MTPKQFLSKLTETMIKQSTDIKLLEFKVDKLIGKAVKEKAEDEERCLEQIKGFKIEPLEEVDDVLKLTEKLIIHC